MFLLHVKNNKSDNDFLEIQHLKTLKQNFIEKIQILNALKQDKNSKLVSSILKRKNSLNKLIKYAIGISLSNTNTNVYVTTIKGDVKYFLSAGSAAIKGKQKRNKSVVLIKLLQILVTQVKFIRTKPVVLYLKHFTNFYVSLALHTLKKYFRIDIIKVYNNKPYNGCRPKKLKRKKRRKLKF